MIKSEFLQKQQELEKILSNAKSLVHEMKSSEDERRYACFFYADSFSDVAETKKLFDKCTEASLNLGKLEILETEIRNVEECIRGLETYKM